MKICHPSASSTCNLVSLFSSSSFSLLPTFLVFYLFSLLFFPSLPFPFSFFLSSPLIFPFSSLIPFCFPSLIPYFPLLQFSHLLFFLLFFFSLYITCMPHYYLLVYALFFCFPPVSTSSLSPCCYHVLSVPISDQVLLSSYSFDILNPGILLSYTSSGLSPLLLYYFSICFFAILFSNSHPFSCP